MILPIIAYGHPVLRQVAQPIGKDFPDLNKLIKDLFETMYEADGVGLAAPQIGQSIRLIVIDATPFAEDAESDEEEKLLEGFRRTFINAEILEIWGDEWAFNEGCLSLPGIHENVMRPSHVRIRYADENFNEHEEVLYGVAARVFQHEYDHLEGKVFTDRLSPLGRRLVQNRLNNISKGKVKHAYPMKFPKK